MPKLLPSDPSLDQLQKQAKDLQKACRAGDRDVLEWVKSLHPAYESTPVEDIPIAGFSLRDAQLVIAREHYFKDWARMKEYILWDAPVKNQEFEILQTRLKEKPSRAKQKVMSFRRDGSTWTNPPLEFVNNHIPMMKLLVDYGATLNAPGLIKPSSTPEFIDYVVEQGGDINKKHYNGSAFLRSVGTKDAALIKHFMLRGVDVNTTHPEIGIVPLHTACRAAKKGDGSRTKIVALLIKAGANVNARALVNVHADWGSGYVVQGETPLHFAAEYGEKEMIDLLLNAGADKTIETALGETPLDCAVKARRTEDILELLR